jgi:hypothetical protein
MACFSGGYESRPDGSIGTVIALLLLLLFNRWRGWRGAIINRDSIATSLLISEAECFY